MDPIILPVKETVEFRSWHVPAASRSGSEHSVTVPVRARQMPRLARSAEGSIQARATLCRAGSKDPGIKPLVPTHCNAATFTLPRCESSCRRGAGRRDLPVPGLQRGAFFLRARPRILCTRASGCRHSARRSGPDMPRRGGGAPASVGRTDGRTTRRGRKSSVAEWLR